MEETLRQLGDIALASIPTIILFLIVYVSYRALVYKPMSRVLAQRYDLTEGAVQKARADIAAAEAKTAEYEQRLREARATVFQQQEGRRQKAHAARSEAVRQAREAASAQIAEARKRIEQETQSAKAQLQPETERLAAEVVRTVLRPVSMTAGGAQ